MKHSLILLFLVACAQTTTTPPDAPSNPRVLCPTSVSTFLVPPPNFGILFGRQAHGTQVYSCSGSLDAGFHWTYVSAQAELHDLVDGHLTELHNGTQWDSVDDGSWIVTKVRQQVYVDQTAIPWALLETSGFYGGPQGDGELTFVRWVQRLSTVDGLPPSNTDCNAGTVGQVVESEYGALYVFYGDEGEGGCR